VNPHTEIFYITLWPWITYVCFICTSKNLRLRETL